MPRNSVTGSTQLAHRMTQTALTARAAIIQVFVFTTAYAQQANATRHLRCGAVTTPTVCFSGAIPRLVVVIARKHRTAAHAKTTTPVQMATVASPVCVWPEHYHRAMMVTFAPQIAAPRVQGVYTRRLPTACRASRPLCFVQQIPAMVPDNVSEAYVQGSASSRTPVTLTAKVIRLKFVRAVMFRVLRSSGPIWIVGQAARREFAMASEALWSGEAVTATAAASKNRLSVAIISACRWPEPAAQRVSTIHTVIRMHSA